MSSQPIWTPQREQTLNSPMATFAAEVERRKGQTFPAYLDLHKWSVQYPAEFWDMAWDHCGVVGDKGDVVLTDGDKMPGAKFFPDAKLNFAENLLQQTGDSDAIIFQAEDKATARLSWDELRNLVSRLQQAMAALAIGPGDRVVAILPNMPEAIAVMLAATSLGAVWSSCSPDFGERGILDRFGQIEPSILIGCDGYWYAGKTIDVGEKLSAVATALAVKTTIVVPLLGNADQVAAAITGGISLVSFTADFAPQPLEFTRLAFDHPLYILFSSGTTGVPKCIVHGAGGALLQHFKEHQLHCGEQTGERVFYFTTLGWMMWNWLVSALAAKATLCLYDGSPFHPSGNVLFDYAERERINVFGTSAKFIDAVKKAGLKPIESHDLSALRMLCSTGSPLAPDSYDFVYAGIKSDLHLASMSGGTDICACFVGANPYDPVHRGEIQGSMLAMATDVWDADGQPVRSEKGELVCTAAFPSMPVQFWNDPDGSKYHNAYFSRFANVWCHGDFAEWTENGGMIIHGRSDATLNPGGVRIGTAEIYNQVEQIPEVVEAICIGQQWQEDVRVVLFVRLGEGVKLNETLVKTIKAKIRDGASPRHVPAKILQVADIPRTKSGKITELAVRDMVHGRPVANRDALANPEALDLYANITELQG